MPSLCAYPLFALVAILLPGAALQRLVRSRVDPALVIPLGTAHCAAAYWLSLAAQTPWLFPVLTLAPVLALAARRTTASADDAALAGPSLRGALPPFLALAALLAVTQFRHNRLDESGDFLLDPLVTYDSAFHVGLTHELAIGYPPQLPGVSGFPLGYHLGTDLVRAAALRWAGVSPWDQVTRLDVLLWGGALMLALRAFVARAGGSPSAVAIVPWTLLLTDFSFVFATNAQAHWWTDLLRGNLLLSLAYANPVVPGLALLLGVLIALARHLETGARGALGLSMALGCALPFFKVFLGAHLLLGLGAAFFLARPGARRALFLVALPCAAGTTALVFGQGGQTVHVSLAPLDLVAVTRETLGLAPLRGPALVAWAAVWLIASLGLRATGLASAVRALRGSAPIAAMAAMALAGWPLGLLFRVSAPEVLDGQRFVNDAAYLVEQSGPLLWVFAATTLAAWATTRLRRAELLLALVALASPTTLQFAVKKARTAPDRLPAPVVRAMAALERASRPGDVVLQRPGARYPAAPVVLCGRRVPYERFTPYLTQFATRAQLEARHALVYRFFRTPERREALAIARSLDARFLALYGGDRVRFDTTGVLDVLHDEPGARLFRIKPDPDAR